MTTASPPPVRPSRRWMVYFVVLVTLAVTGIILPIVYNLGLQLRPEQLAEARQRWAEQGPRDYDLTFSITYDRETLAQRHIVLVRGGQVVCALTEGQLDYLAPALAAVTGLPLTDPRESQGLDVPGLFAHIGEVLDKEKTATRRNFLVANFDSRLGYPRRFIYRVRGTGTREEWNVAVWRAGELAERAPR